jgi:hypothetical protein
VRLRPVPGAAVLGAQAGHQLNELIERLSAHIVKSKQFNDLSFDIVLCPSYTLSAYALRLRRRGFGEMSLKDSLCEADHACKGVGLHYNIIMQKSYKKIAIGFLLTNFLLEYII